MSRERKAEIARETDAMLQGIDSADRDNDGQVDLDEVGGGLDAYYMMSHILVAKG